MVRWSGDWRCREVNGTGHSQHGNSRSDSALAQWLVHLKSPFHSPIHQFIPFTFSLFHFFTISPFHVHHHFTVSPGYHRSHEAGP
jgi:hypothetical protein